MKVRIGFKSKLPGIIAMAILAMVVETVLIWWVINQFYTIDWQQALAIYITRFLVVRTWRIRKAD